MIDDTFTPNEGVTAAEKYLNNICRRTFLSLWSYSGLFKSPGDELCDLLVVFENDIIIFSDKYCKFPDTGILSLDWKRWFKRTIYKAAEQAWGAERWIKKYPERIFRDNKASIPFPFQLPDLNKAHFHLIVVAHDGSRRCVEYYGGSGSMMINSGLIGSYQHDMPFHIGDLDRNKSFVHVLDDTTLNILLGKLDTITDFVSYLKKKEVLLRSKQIIIAAGEEELLATYLKYMNSNDEHDFMFPKKYSFVSVDEGMWKDYISNPQVLRQLEADKISYVWDELIEKFNHHTLSGTKV